MRIDMSDDAFALQIETPGLGDHSYVVVAGGSAVLVDPQRDTARFERPLALSGADPLAVVETHIHNDYVTGGHLLARGLGVDYVLPPDTGSRLPHRIAGSDWMLSLGAGWTMTAIATPGHTPNHTSYVLVGPGGPAALFTGGSMLVGGVGRTDLISAAATEELTRLQFRSVRALASGHPGPTLVLPTHGSGSFCSATEISGGTSTIAAERRHNPALTAPGEDAFVESQLGSLRRYPDYYAHMAPINLEGAPPMPSAPAPLLSPEAVVDAVGEGAVVVDVRPSSSFAAAHLPGSINIPYSDLVGTYIGWVLPWTTPVVLVAGDAGVAESVRIQLARIGHDRIAGVLDGGLAAWEATGRAAGSFAVVDFNGLDPAVTDVVLDVRDPLETDDGMVEDAVNVHVASVGERAAHVMGDRTFVYCASGYRAAVAASLVAREGGTPVLVADDFENYNAPARRA